MAEVAADSPATIVPEFPTISYGQSLASGLFDSKLATGEICTFPTA